MRSAEEIRAALELDSYSLPLHEAVVEELLADRERLREALGRHGRHDGLCAATGRLWLLHLRLALVCDNCEGNGCYPDGEANDTTVECEVCHGSGALNPEARDG